MSFLYPGFLFAAFILAIPVIIHLFHFRKYKTVRFSSLRFLRNIETERKNRNRLKHLLVLGSRILAFSCLVLAFAIPGCNKKMLAATGKKNICIFIDNTYSMQSRNSDGILFETAKNKAREIVRASPQGSEFCIFSQTMGPEKKISASDAIEAIDKIQISPRSEDFTSTWQRLMHSGINYSSNSLFYFISDFQQSYLRKLPSKEGARSGVFGIHLTGVPASNISVDSAWLQNPFALVGEKNKVFFVIHNYSDKNEDAVNVKLNNGPAVVGLSQLSVEKHNSAIGFIDFTMPAGKKNTFDLHVDDPNVEFDNTLYLAPSVQGEIQIGVIGSNSFLTSALRTNVFFKTSNIDYPQVAASKFQTLYVIVKDRISSANGLILQNFVNNGGRVVLIPDENMPLDGFREFTHTSGFPIFSKWESAEVKMSKQGLSHPFFQQVFQDIPKNIEMPKVQKWYSTGGNSGSGEAILSMENGEPLLLKFPTGKGMFYMFTTPFNPSAGNFVQSILFFPVVSNCAFGHEVSSQLYSIAASGNGYLLQNGLGNGDGNLMLRKDQREWFAEIQSGLNGKELYISSDYQEPGFYELFDKTNAEKPQWVALNIDRNESNPEMAADENLELLTRNTGMQWLNGGAAIASATQSKTQSQLWRLFIWLAAAFFALEVLLLVFWDKAGTIFHKTPSTNTNP